MVQKLIDRVCGLFSFLMVACLALMVVMVFGNVVLRYGFNSGITVSEELSRWLFVWMTFLGALVALRTHSHLGTDSLVARLPRAGRSGRGRSQACRLLGLASETRFCTDWLVFRSGKTRMGSIARRLVGSLARTHPTSS